MNKKVIGIDLGATNIRGAIVDGDTPLAILSRRIKSAGTVNEVRDDIYNLTDELLANNRVEAIGIGVPSVVDVEEGIVYDVQYIPSWKEVHLKQLMQARYNIPVYVNNDANCFAVGEYHFGKGKGSASIIGLTIGTGLGAGVIINSRLFAGTNCGAGEFGCLPYLDNIMEYYCSGSFFQNVHGLDGLQVFNDAQRGDEKALNLYLELGAHLGNAIKMIMYTYDPELIVLGGSVSHAFPLLQQTMWEQVKTFMYEKSAQRIKIEVSALENSGILGAAALYYDSLTK
jgi:glucokinase